MAGLLHITDTDLRARGVAVLSDYRPPAERTGRVVWIRPGARCAFLLGNRECDGVIESVNDACGTAHVRITAPAIMKGSASIRRFADLIDADCPPAEDRYGDEDGQGGAA